MEAPTGLPDWFLTALVGLLVMIVAWLNRERLGLSTVQLATKQERDKLVEIQERRIRHLESEIKRLEDEIRYISSANADLRRRLSDLEGHKRNFKDNTDDLPRN